MDTGKINESAAIADDLSDAALEETLMNISGKNPLIDNETGNAATDALEPPSPAPATPNTPSSQAAVASEFNAIRARAFLTLKKWPIGMQETFLQNLKRIPIRFFICDDSGSMKNRDGHMNIDVEGVGIRMEPCSRWEELSAALKFHAELSRAASAPTEFRFLNTSPAFRIGFGEENEDAIYSALMNRLDQLPMRTTPLCRHIREVIAEIAPLESQLRNAGQKACIVIASDGESSDGDIVTAMRPLRLLPVWVVIRLCTDRESIVDYWNNIDNQLELDMDVLDDLSGEAKEVYTANSWLTYGEPIHRLHEFGVLIKEADLMDTTPLTADQIRRFCTVIFRGSIDDYPHPELDWEGFIGKIQSEVDKAAPVWNPVTNKMTPWINVPQVKKMKPRGSAGSGSCCSIS